MKSKITRFISQLVTVSLSNMPSLPPTLPGPRGEQWGKFRGVRPSFAVGRGPRKRPPRRGPGCCWTPGWVGRGSLWGARAPGRPLSPSCVAPSPGRSHLARTRPGCVRPGGGGEGWSDGGEDADGAPGRDALQRPGSCLGPRGGEGGGWSREQNRRAGGRRLGGEAQPPAPCAPPALPTRSPRPRRLPRRPQPLSGKTRGLGGAAGGPRLRLCSQRPSNRCGLAAGAEGARGCGVWAGGAPQARGSGDREERCSGDP